MPAGSTGAPHLQARTCAVCIQTCWHCAARIPSCRRSAHGMSQWTVPRPHQILLLRYADGDHLLLLLINLGSLTRFAMNDPMVALERDRRWELMFCSERPKSAAAQVLMKHSWRAAGFCSPIAWAAARRSVIAAAVNERPDLRPVDLARRDRQERRSREQSPRIQIGPEPESSGRRGEIIRLCRKGAVAEEMVERADVPADSADAVHLVDNGQRIRDDTGHVGGNTTSNDSSGNFRVAASICSSWMRVRAQAVRVDVLGGLSQHFRRHIDASDSAIRRIERSR